MKIISNKTRLIKFIKSEKNLGFVPTMGAIHSGHKSLIKRSIDECDKTIVSIFINKPQFNRKSDYKKYPRLIKKDINILKKLKINYLYLPSEKQIYPSGRNKNIKVDPFSKKLCGKHRPGHFEAITDVVERFINIIKPKKIYFGEKDFQQLKIIENFLNKNYVKIKVVACKTIRENNGIPYSSRNLLLSLKEKEIASKIYRLLLLNKKKIIKNKKLINYFKKRIMMFGVNKIDYLEIKNINKIIKPYKRKKNIKFLFHTI